MFHHGFGSPAILVSQMLEFKKHDARVKSSEIELAQNNIVKSYSINVQEINLLNVVTDQAIAWALRETVEFASATRQITRPYPSFS